MWAASNTTHGNPPVIIDPQGNVAPNQWQDFNDAIDVDGQGNINAFAFSLYDSTLSLINNYPKVHLKVYPNPTENYVYIESSIPQEKITLNLYNLLGEEVPLVKQGDRLNIINLPAGLYMLQITANHQTISKTIIKK